MKRTPGLMSRETSAPREANPKNQAVICLLQSGYGADAAASTEM